jgi:hypothetical protein
VVNFRFPDVHNFEDIGDGRYSFFGFGWLFGWHGFVDGYGLKHENDGVSRASFAAYRVCS